MATMLSSLLVLALSGFFGVGLAGPEYGLWFFDFFGTDIKKDGKTYVFYKSMFNNSHIGLSIVCEGSELIPVTINWLVRQSPCANEYLAVTEEQAEAYLKETGYAHESLPYRNAKFVKNTIKINCTKDQHQIIHQYIYKDPDFASYGAPATKVTKVPADEVAKKQKDASVKEAINKQAQAKQDEVADKVRVRRADEAIITIASVGQNKTNIKPGSELEQNGKLVRVWEDGYYLFVLQFVVDKPPEKKDFKMRVTVKMSYGNSYLSAVEWPLLIFYGVMGLVYILFGLFWLVMLACNWRDLLRVQFWIGAVIFLGMLEKAVFFGEYENVNNTGQSVRGAIIVAELVSCLKRTLARMLVLIVSLGYGIVKPRLGQTFRKVLFVGVVFFILASIESCSRALSGRADQSVKLLVASIPLAVTDAIICWWIFSSLLQTTRTLRLRRNVVKLSLYRHFTNTLIFSVIASVAYIIWFMTQHKLKECITDWRELWIDDAFWHLLFSVILFVIMILWRPSANNQRYAFSPLLDAADDDDLDDEQALSEAYDGMKMRTTNSQQRNGSPRVKDDQKMEDDLKWVEDNIPSSLADRVLPALDSDEEIMNTKFEVSKME